MLAALVEFRDRRVLILDGSSAEPLVELSELTTGFMRQRIDILLATTSTLAVIPAEFHSRWRIAEVLSLPDSDRHPQISLEGRELRIDDLTITPARVIAGEWRVDSPQEKSDWLVTVTYARSRIAVASNGAAVEHLVPEPGSATGVICTDEEIERWPARASAVILVAPPEAGVFDERDPTSERVFIPFHQRYPMTFGLAEAGIELPSSY